MEKSYIKVVPINKKKTKNKYTIQYLSGGVISKIESGELETYKLRDDLPTLEIREYKTAGSTIPTIWLDKAFHTTNGSNQIKNILGSKEFPYPKPLELIVEVLNRVIKNDSIILDFFAGSGTTGQAVFELNRLSDKNCRFILCTNNENNICENVTYKRLKHIIMGYDFTGKIEDILYEKKFSLKDLNSVEKYLAEVNEIVEKYQEEYQKCNVTFKDGILKVQGIRDTKNGVNGIPANLKYYKTDFIPKSSNDEFYSVGERLTEHIKEMVQLEHGISLDNRQYLLILTDEEADELEKNVEKLSKCKGIYISSSVFLTAEQEKVFGDKALITIPDYYFEDELREVGEL